MKKRKWGRFALAVLLFWGACLTLGISASAETNAYRGIDYGGSREEVEELERILRSEGYVCVTEGYSDNEEWTKTLYEDKDYPYFFYIPQEEYRLYVYPLDYENYLKGKYISLYCNTVLCDYYVFDSQVEEGNCTGYVGEAIPEWMDSGYLTIKIDMEQDFLDAHPNAVYTIILYGEETDRYYDLSASMILENDCIIRKRVPCDRYFIYSAYASYEYPSDISGFKDGFKVAPDRNREITIPFRKTELPVVESEPEETSVREPARFLSFFPNGGLDVDGQAEQVKEKSLGIFDRLVAILPVLLILAFALFGAYAYVRYLWKKNHGGEYVDEDDN